MGVGGNKVGWVYGVFPRREGTIACAYLRRVVDAYVKGRREPNCYTGTSRSTACYIFL